MSILLVDDLFIVFRCLLLIVVLQFMNHILLCRPAVNSADQQHILQQIKRLVTWCLT